MAVVLTLALSSLLLAGWFVLTQPMVLRRPLHEVPAVDPQRLEAHVRMLSESFVPRDYLHVENLDRAARYIAQALQESGGRVEEQLFEVEGRTYRNVVARFGPTEGAPVVVGAHYDTFDELPGADDNASGVAGLLELARILGANPPQGPMELVAYTLEEPPYFRSQNMGSARHASALKAKSVAVRAMLALEMIGYFSEEAGSQQFPVKLIQPLYPDRGNFVAVVGRFADMPLTRTVKAAMQGATPLDVRSLNAPRKVRGIDLSDHHAYWDAGFPAVMITDTAFFRNQAYHTDQDTAERLDYRRMAQVVQGVWAATRVLTGS
ncbi:MAG: M28 family peptidase [Deltaproteobacteria bacterium]|nr:M28 family peptidase [Deltaproteobacteria bacterium]